MLTQFILGSRSPRRRELLAALVPADSIRVLPPRDAAEAEFAGLSDLAAIRTRLLEIARTKFADVTDQVRHLAAGSPETRHVVIAADTTIVVPTSEDVCQVLGQPPEDSAWADTVRVWFQELFAGRTHQALTALYVGIVGTQPLVRTVSTEVTFRDDVDRYLDWYLATGESQGKAGGYALQGAGSVFISRVQGSLSNVIGLPLETLLDCLRELQVAGVTGD